MDELNSDKGLLVSPETEFLRAGKVVQSLLKTLKNIMIYPEDNPIPLEQKKKFFQQISEFLDDYEELRLQIRYSQLYYRGEMIYQDHKEKEGLAYSMHRDGISEITLKEGLTANELSNLMQVFKAGLSLSSLEDDLVTLLWEHDLDHISYRVIDEFLGEEPEITLVEQPFSDFNRLDDTSSVHYSEVNLPERQGREEDEKSRATVQKSLKNVKGFVEEEVIKIDHLLKKDEDFQGMQEVLSIIQEVLSPETELPEFNDTVRSVEKTLDGLLENGEFQSSFMIVKFIRQLEQSYREKSPRRSSRLAEAVNRAADSERIKLIVAALNKDEQMDLKWARAYLGSLHWNSIFNILNMLGELRAYQTRRMTCDVLAAFGKEHFQMVTRGLRDHRWYVVRNVVGVLGRIGNPKAIPYLKDTIKHEESRVRRETIRALELMGGPEAARVMLLALDDPSTRLRIKAVNLIGKTGEKAALEPLSEMMKSKHFKEKSEEEKKAVLFSLAEVGKDQVVPALGKIARKRSWFGRQKDQDAKILAIKALGLIDTAGSRHTLEELSRKGKKELREISQRILKKLDRRIGPEAQDHDT